MEMGLSRSLDGEGDLVSVIIPTYNDREYLSKAVNSVFEQTHNNIEIIVIDSSETEWVASLASNSDRIVYEQQPPNGPSAARNRGIELANGEIISFLDADDYWHPEKLTMQLRVFDEGADVVYSDAYIVENENEYRLRTLPVTEPSTHYRKFLFEGGVPLVTVSARRTCLRGEKFDESLKASEDRHLLVRLFREYTPARVPRPLAYYRRRSGSATSDADFMYENEEQALELLFERYPDLKQYRRQLLHRAKYAYGKRLIRNGKATAARSILFEIMREGYIDIRVLGAFLASLPPVYNTKLLGLMEKLQTLL
jgi:glycosyltransferase involved in cell wall biosynthesis